MSSPLAGKVALVTGGSRGLGAATVRALAEAGAQVAFTYVASAERANALAEETNTVALQHDQADTSLAPGLIKEVVARLGGLDILVNNAAIGDGSGRTIDDPEADTEGLDRQHATNYLGPIALIRAASRVMRDGGRIINIGSGIGSRVGAPGFADYAATKAGLTGYTKGAARDLAPRGITVNLVQAGLMDTSFTPPDPKTLEVMLSNLAIQRVSDPAETATVITFLAGPGSGYITGAVLDVNGGYTA
ncbi:SDR family NAD(P)-dependent oxidoreductase [Kutzneria sp. CA-103260]|uniref:SDR family NAD(P)-dependent oxidoreductase n=1 Tax=Kutzneria sp. CA-103260 TaxID=2802641 RepID=UPI001BABF706|nr:SDR family oxidoreductase [Kutzneria sp. CA-103260]QUQ63583.1 oxidoreductase [Kutzneria sp. CA-103260]